MKTRSHSLLKKLPAKRSYEIQSVFFHYQAFYSFHENLQESVFVQTQAQRMMNSQSK